MSVVQKEQRKLRDANSNNDDLLYKFKATSYTLVICNAYIFYEEFLK